MPVKFRVRVIKKVDRFQHKEVEETTTTRTVSFRATVKKYKPKTEAEARQDFKDLFAEQPVQEECHAV